MAALVNHGPEVRDQLGHHERASGLLCPKCRGGQSGERSLLAWRTGLELRAKCKRAKCGWYGRWDSVDLGMLPLGAGTPAQGKRYVLETMPLTEHLQAALEARYRVQGETLAHYGVRQMSGGRAVYAPVWSPDRRLRGWVRRWLDGTLPKVKGYPGWDHPQGAAWMAWFPRQRGGLVVAVEDVFSAMRLWERGISAVALLGVSLSGVKLAELRRFAGTIVLALDDDAFGLALETAVRHSIQVRFVEPDIKDMTEEQLTRWITALHSSLPASAPATHAPSYPLPGSSPTI
jgi:hypothetical protein